MIQKPIIIAIVGESGSGKTLLSFLLAHKLNIPTIVSFTTRPMREGELNGVDHYFVDDDAVPEQSEMFAYTCFGGYHYWTVPDQFASNQIMTYIVDEIGLLEMVGKWSEQFTVIAVKILRPNNPTDSSRRSRDNGRLHIDDSIYDAVIINGGSKKEFFRQAVLALGNSISQYIY